MLRVWGSDYDPGNNQPDVHMSRLRNKIEEHPSKPRLLLTIRGIGYKLQPRLNAGESLSGEGHVQNLTHTGQITCSRKIEYTGSHENDRPGWINERWGMGTNWRKHRAALIVDDERPILELLAELLVEEGFQTTCFDHGKPAVEALTRDRFDLLLIDVGLPDMNGLEICAKARDIYGSAVTIVVITADTRHERLLTAMELGADDFVPKPFLIEELLARIDAKLRFAERSRP